MKLWLKRRARQPGNEKTVKAFRNHRRMVKFIRLYMKRRAADVSVS